MIMHTCFHVAGDVDHERSGGFRSLEVGNVQSEGSEAVEQEQKIHVNRLARVESFPLSHCPIKLVKKGVSAYRVIGTSSKAPRLLF